MSTDTFTEAGRPAAMPPIPDLSELHPSAQVGIAYNPFDPTFLRDPHAFFKRARAEAPVCFNPVFNMWLVTGHQEVMTVCKDPVVFSSKNKVDPPVTVLPEVLRILNEEGYPVARQLFNSDPPEHGKIRALLGQGLSKDRLASQEPSMLQLANDAVDGFIEDGAADLREAYTFPVPLSAILDLLGAPREDHAQIKAWDDAWARLFTSAYAIDDQLEAVREVVAYQKYWEAILDDRRAHPQGDLPSALVHATVEGRPQLSNAELIWQFMGLLAAGHATTTDALTNLLYVLLSERHRWEALCEQPGEIMNAINEGLRLVNPVLGLPRVTTREVKLGGVTLPEGAEVLLSFCSASRDDHVVSEPDDFIPTRENVAHHLGYGWGIHHCIGSRMADAMMRQMLEVLTRRMPTLTLEAEYEPEFNVHPFLWGIRRLPVTWS
jgi:cytochrome P450